MVDTVEFGRAAAVLVSVRDSVLFHGIMRPQHGLSVQTRGAHPRGVVAVLLLGVRGSVVGDRLAPVAGVQWGVAAVESLVRWRVRGGIAGSICVILGVHVALGKGGHLWQLSAGVSYAGGLGRRGWDVDTRGARVVGQSVAVLHRRVMQAVCGRGLTGQVVGGAGWRVCMRVNVMIGMLLLLLLLGRLVAGGSAVGWVHLRCVGRHGGTGRAVVPTGEQTQWYFCPVRVRRYNRIGSPRPEAPRIFLPTSCRSKIARCRNGGSGGAGLDLVRDVLRPACREVDNGEGV